MRFYLQLLALGMQPIFNITQSDSIDWPAWIQAGAAVFAALGLFWTLRLQSKATRLQAIATDAQVEFSKEQSAINKAQLDALSRDYARFLKEIQPELYFEVGRELNPKYGWIRYTVRKNPAYSLLIEHRERVKYSFNGLANKPYDANIDIHPIFNFIGEFTEEELLANENDDSIYLKATFKDFMGNAYFQHITVVTDPVLAVIHSIPQKIG
ncbi:hypothetical protein [Mucilaginibacter sp.]|uniref:hypothetical protein n=1 Tax=Mucilaginibacter sp. TaxID=1882438 RepID=UPI0035BC31F8